VATVDNFTSKARPLAVLSESIVTTRYLLLPSLFLLIFFGLFCGSAAANADASNAPATPAAAGPQFAIADFDGDRRPDLASIQAAPNTSGTTSYRINLQLTGSGPRSIGVIAPSGGLLITARDVNGDHAVDLLLTTVWFKRPVAILINDGHGNFSRVEPVTFLGAFKEYALKLGSAARQATDILGIPVQSPPAGCTKARTPPHVRPQANSVLPSSEGFPLSSFLGSHAGRAPPFHALRS
jgi:hypothetical protein